MRICNGPLLRILIQPPLRCAIAPGQRERLDPAERLGLIDTASSEASDFCEWRVALTPVYTCAYDRRIISSRKASPGERKRYEAR
jgi:hypothetical protein